MLKSVIEIEYMEPQLNSINSKPDKVCTSRSRALPFTYAFEGVFVDILEDAFNKRSPINGVPPKI